MNLKLQKIFKTKQQAKAKVGTSLWAVNKLKSKAALR